MNLSPVCEYRSLWKDGDRVLGGCVAPSVMGFESWTRDGSGRVIYAACESHVRLLARDLLALGLLCQPLAVHLPLEAAS